MSTPMALCKLSDALLHGQLGFKWHFWLWGLYGYVQWWGHTSIQGYTLLRDALVWFEHYIIYSTSSIIDYIEHLTMSKWTFFCWTLKAPLRSNAHILYWFYVLFIYSIFFHLICTIIIHIIIFPSHKCWYIVRSCWCNVLHYKTN